MQKIRMYWFEKAKGCKGNQRGSFTIEASLIFPIIFMLILAIFFISIVIFQKLILYYFATQAADRLAHSWDNSHKNILTAQVPLGDNDGLYWRLLEDDFFSFLFRSNKNYHSMLSLEDPVYTSLSEKKMFALARELPKGLGGKIIYQNNQLERDIIVELESSIYVPEFVKVLIGDQLRVQGKSTITEPTEYIRNIDFLLEKYKWLSENQETFKQIFNKQKGK